MATDRLFTAFNFLVEISVPDVSDELCKATFSECEGLEMTMEPKTFHQGGQNNQQVHLAGKVSYGQLTLKRGMSQDFGLWRWFSEVMKTTQREIRGQGLVVMLSSARNEQITFKLKDCLPIKLRAPALNAQSGGIAIEEMQLVYSALEVEFDSPQTNEVIQSTVRDTAQNILGINI